jgi:GNAT superfamily N-acetyltransferase
MATHTVFTLRQRPDLIPQVHTLSPQVWPEFLLHNASGVFWPSLFDTFAEFQFAFCDEAGTIIAAGDTIPVVWDGTVEGLPSGWDAVIELGVRGHAQGRQPNTLSALAAIVAPSHQGRGMSTLILQQMRKLAADHGCHSLIAPVRPTLKNRYPLTPIERYVEWKQPDGALFDPWLRTHARLGAELLRVAPQSMTITGSVAEWEEWTQMRFPESGAYVVPGALQPVMIDCEHNLGRYDDPNVWMRHTINNP